MPWTIGRWTRRGTNGGKFSKNGLATKRDRAIDLSCRACGAGAWALGLDSRLGTPASLPSFFPTSDKTKLKLDREVGVGICFCFCVLVLNQNAL